MNYFHYFDLEESFSVDQEKLRKNFLNRSREVHPDLHQDNSDMDLIQLSAINNEGFKILKDEFLTIRHVLEINGYDVSNHEKASPVFLAEMMELNEMIDEARELENETKILECDQAIRAVESEARRSWSEVSSTYAKNMSSDDKQRLFHEASRYLMVMKYVKRMKSLLRGENEL